VLRPTPLAVFHLPNHLVVSRVLVGASGGFVVPIMHNCLRLTIRCLESRREHQQSRFMRAAQRRCRSRVGSKPHALTQSLCSCWRQRTSVDGPHDDCHLLDQPLSCVFKVIDAVVAVKRAELAVSVSP
jgi:hypothetical protein